MPRSSALDSARRPAIRQMVRLRSRSVRRADTVGALSSRRSAHVDEVHDEDERLARSDRTTRAAVAVREVRRDDQLTTSADLHADDALVPARDDPAGPEREVEGVAAVVRRVELLPGREGDTDVVDDGGAA